MQTYLGLVCIALGLSLVVACSSKENAKTVGVSVDKSAPSELPDTGDDGGDGRMARPIRTLDLADVTSHAERYTWFDFRPNVKKLILAGAPETEHIAILWYTAADGGVGLHYHAKTESVYVIDGTQTDAKGDYPSGTVYFNPPGSGHQITHSTGFFLLAYAAAPDFTGTDRIQEYTPVRMDLTGSELPNQYTFTALTKGVRSYALPVPSEGGMSAELIELTSGGSHTYRGNYLLVLSGACAIAGTTYAAKKLVVTNTVDTYAYALRAAESGACLLLGVAFRTPPP